MSFTNCTVTLNDEILFQPEWGVFDMGVGLKVYSVFTGAADRGEYESNSYISPTTTVTNNYPDKEYIRLYQKVREVREKNSSEEDFIQLFNDVKQGYSEDWLLSIELYELIYKQNNDLAKEIKTYLLEKGETKVEYKKLILDGTELIEKT